MEETQQSSRRRKLNIALFPWLAYGHLMPYFHVSKFLAEKGHNITYISATKNINRLPEIPSHLSQNYNFLQVSMPHVDGLPSHVESTSDLPLDQIPFLKKAYDLFQPELTRFLQNSNTDWIIVDFCSHWLPSLASELGVKSVYFSIFSATTSCFGGPPSEYLNPRRKKLEDYTVVPDWIDYPCNVAFKLHEIRSLGQSMDDSVSDFERAGMTIRDCHAVIVRACREFELTELSLLSRFYQKPVLPIGLLPPEVNDYSLSDDGNWKMFESWLDDKEENSVVYVALGTESTLSRELMHELAYGLEKSNSPFIWVVRSRNGSGVDSIPDGFENRVSGRGMVWTDWAPQLKILSHKSVGGFLTHCGWSSVIEGLGFGRVLILLSGASSDTGLVARLMHGRRVGMEIERNEEDGLFTSDSVAEAIHCVMVGPEGHEIRKNARSMKKIFSDVDLNRKYLDEFASFLENY